MTLTQITCFLEIARCRSFSKAAAHLFISQPAVSKQLAQLEKSLGTVLIDRSGGTATLTELGKLYFEFFDRAETEFHSVEAECHRLSNSRSGEVRLGCMDGWDLSAFYPELKKLFLTKHPQLRLTLDGYNHFHVLDALIRGEIDVALTLEISLSGRSDLCHRNIASSPIVILLSVLHPLAGKPDLSLADLKDDPFYVIAPAVNAENPMKQLTLDLCRQAGFEPKIEYTSNSASILMRLQAGQGAQITCAWTGACRMPMYRMVPLTRTLNISAAWMDNGFNPAKRVFLDELFRHYRS